MVTEISCVTPLLHLCYTLNYLNINNLYYICYTVTEILESIEIVLITHTRGVYIHVKRDS